LRLSLFLLLLVLYKRYCTRDVTKDMRYKKRKPKVDSKPFVVLYDDREDEEHRWHLPYKMEKKRLKCGDYTVKGFENVMTIEKKSGFEEVFKDLAVKYRPTFEKFLKKLSAYPVKCIVVEDELSNLHKVWYALKRKAPKMRMYPESIYFWAAQTIAHGIPVIFVRRDVAGLGMTIEILKAAYKRAQEIKQ